MSDPEDKSLGQFLADLEAAVALHQGGRKADQGDQTQARTLRAWMAALNSLRTFLKAKKAQPSSIFLVMELTAALNDTLEGNLSPALVSRKSRGAPVQPTMHRIQWAAACALIDLLVSAGMSQEDAARKLVRQMSVNRWPKLPKKTHSEQPEWSRLLKWRERVKSRPPSSDESEIVSIERQFYGATKGDIDYFLSAGASIDTIIEYYFRVQMATPKPE